MTPESTRRAARLASYSAAAAATSLGAGTADASTIVYSGVQNIDIPIYNSTSLNLDGDAYNDILLKNYGFLGGPYQGATVSFYPGGLVGFFGSTNGYSYVSALSTGDLIGASQVTSFFGSLAYGAVNPEAEFNNANGAFIGLTFPSGPNNYSAWVRVNIDNAAGTFTVVDWAYESTPGRAIFAGATVPAPGPLAAMAAGMAGLGLVRKRKHVA